MNKIVVAAGVLQIIGGLLVYGQARSAIHEILGAISLGMGVLTIAVAVTNRTLREIRDLLVPGNALTRSVTPQTERVRQEVADARQQREPDLRKVGALFKDV